MTLRDKIPVPIAPSASRLEVLGGERIKNRSPDIVVSCFFGRILPSKARTESWIV